MLNKEERVEIAERLKSTEYITISTLFKALTGEEKLSEASHVKSLCIICSIILDLCDTSNMIELPLDKDGQVINVGDTVYNENMDKCSVKSIEYGKDNNVCIHCFTFSTLGVLSYYPHQLTHTFISETEQLTKALKNAVDTFNERLREVATYMGSLGDSDD